MWSLLNALPIFKPAATQPTQTQTESVYPLLIRSDTSSSSSSQERNVKLADPSQPKTLFCCPHHQIPSSACPTSHNLTLFLRALTLRQQEMAHHTNMISSKTLFQPIIKADLSHTSKNPMVIELETSTWLNSAKRIFEQRYFVARQGLQRTDVEMYPEGAFYEITFQEVQRIKEPLGDGGFLKKDEVATDRVAWYCEECGGGYWVRVIANGESVSVFR